MKRDGMESNGIEIIGLQQLLIGTPRHTRHTPVTHFAQLIRRAIWLRLYLLACLLRLSAGSSVGRSDTSSLSARRPPEAGQASGCRMDQCRSVRPEPVYQTVSGRPACPFHQPIAVGRSGIRSIRSRWHWPGHSTSPSAVQPYLRPSGVRASVRQRDCHGGSMQANGHRRLTHVMRLLADDSQTASIDSRINTGEQQGEEWAAQ